MNISHKSHPLLLLIRLILFSSIISMACVLCESCDFFPKGHISLDLDFTEELTDPNVPVEIYRFAHSLDPNHGF